MENEAKELLRKLRRYVSDNSGSVITNLMYISPAQAMRNVADAMEAKDALLREIDQFLERN